MRRDVIFPVAISCAGGYTLNDGDIALMRRLADGENTVTSFQFQQAVARILLSLMSRMRDAESVTDMHRPIGPGTERIESMFSQETIDQFVKEIEESAKGKACEPILPT